MASIKKKNEKKFVKKRYFDEDNVKHEEKIDSKITKNNDGEEEKVIRVRNYENKISKETIKRLNKKRKLKDLVDPKVLKRYSHGEGSSGRGIFTKTFKAKYAKQELNIEFSEAQAARTELLLNEEEGCLVADEDESTANITQDEIVKHVDITAATKRFDLNLNFGPYKMTYTRNGRHLLVGGKKGHVAAFDWVRKTLHCEMNVMEEVFDVAWLHVETMFAVAQKNWVHFYDNKGVELHCVKQMHRPNRLEFLPYHFLLASGSSEGYLNWLDISIGEMVGSFNSKMGKISMMATNPSNGVLCVGGSKGVVSMWSPKVKEPLAQMLCSKSPLTAIAVDPKGMYMATAAVGRQIKIWDIRQLNGPLADYRRIEANHLDISQKGMLAATSGSYCTVFKNPLREETVQPYLKYHCNGFASGLKFCPYEDVLGISTQNGFNSILVPGSGEPNFDAREANPYQTKKQRREHEVHALLEKIPAEFITLDPNAIIEVDVPTLKDRVEAKTKLLHMKPPKIDYEPRKKMKGKGGSANLSRNKQRLQEQVNRKFRKEIQIVRDEFKEDAPEGNDSTNDDFIPIEMENTKAKSSVLDRFKPKPKNKV